MLTEVDGSIMEGGGQMLRMTGSLSAIFRKPVRIIKIRAGRASPGLKAQHLTGLNLVRDITNGKLEGAAYGSKEIVFHPGPLSGGEFSADTKSAGAFCLLAQIALPCSLFAPTSSVLNLRGGTNADMAPQIDEFTEVFLPNLKHFGPTVEYEVVRKGFFPKGGGEVNLYINPIKYIKPINRVDVGNIVSLTGWCFVAGSLPIKWSADKYRDVQGGGQRILRQRFRDCPRRKNINGMRSRWFRPWFAEDEPREDRDQGGLRDPRGRRVRWLCRQIHSGSDDFVHGPSGR